MARDPPPISSFSPAVKKHGFSPKWPKWPRDESVHEDVSSKNPIPSGHQTNAIPALMSVPLQAVVRGAGVIPYRRSDCGSHGVIQTLAKTNMSHFVIFQVSWCSNHLKVFVHMQSKTMTDHGRP